MATRRSLGWIQNVVIMCRRCRGWDGVIACKVCGVACVCVQCVVMSNVLRHKGQLQTIEYIYLDGYYIGIDTTIERTKGEEKG
jgi:hypothetical protein